MTAATYRCVWCGETAGRDELLADSASWRPAVPAGDDALAHRCSTNPAAGWVRLWPDGCHPPCAPRYGKRVDLDYDWRADVREVAEEIERMECAGHDPACIEGVAF